LSWNDNQICIKRNGGHWQNYVGNKIAYSLFGENQIRKITKRRKISKRIERMHVKEEESVEEMIEEIKEGDRILCVKGKYNGWEGRVVEVHPKMVTFTPYFRFDKKQKQHCISKESIIRDDGEADLMPNVSRIMALITLELDTIESTYLS